MKRLALAVALLVTSIAAALAQSTVSVIGPITPGDCPQFSSNTVLKDSGFNCNGAPAVPFANPSATVGLTAVSGGAATAMRSDAAPPLSASVQSALTGLNNGMIFGTGAFGFSSTATPTVAGTIAYFNGTTWVLLAGNTTGIQTLTENSSGVPSWSASGAGSVTSITPGAGLASSTTVACSQTAITTSGTLSKAECVNAQTGTSYAVADGDRAKLIKASNAAAQAYTIAQAGAASNFQSGWLVDIQNNSAIGGIGIVTITPTTSSLCGGAGGAAYKLYPGQGVRIISDSTNYQCIPYGLTPGSEVLLNTLTASSSATLSDTTSITAAFKEYRLVFENVLPAAASVNCQLQVNSGGVQATSYVTNTLRMPAGGTPAANSSTTFIPCDDDNSQLTNSGAGVSGELILFNPSQTISRKQVHGQMTQQVAAGSYLSSIIWGVWDGGNGAITGIQVQMSTSLITSGAVKIYGRQ